MSRSVQYRRQISDLVSWRQDQALNATIYILRETGPTGFLLKTDGENKKVKVYLGDPHHCTCSTFQKDRDLCHHICWVLLRKFRLSRHDPVSWQLGLVEREINDVLQGPAPQQAPRARDQTETAAKLVGPDGQSMLEQRSISADDVCPICQDELLAKHEPVTYCRFGCGNSVHIKCMKVWADHQASTGEKNIKCPFCREDFGSFDLLKKEFNHTSATGNNRRPHHLGLTCESCRASPITGKCYRCSVCTDVHLCQTCFNSPFHQQHAFLYRQRSMQRWKPAQRGPGTLLPEAVVTNLMNREISDTDYGVLLQLDSVTSDTLGSLSEEVIQSLPLEKVRRGSRLLAPGEQCRVCLRTYQLGQDVRRLPCRHKFHKHCIDNWLLHQRAMCPVDGTHFTDEMVRQLRDAKRQRKSSENVNSRERSGSGIFCLEIPGIGVARKNSTQSSPSVLAADAFPNNFVLAGSTYGRDRQSISTNAVTEQLNAHHLDPGSTANMQPVAPSIPLPRSERSIVLSSHGLGDVRRPPSGHSRSGSGQRSRGSIRADPTHGTLVRSRSGSRDRSRADLHLNIGLEGTPPTPAINNQLKTRRHNQRHRTSHRRQFTGDLNSTIDNPEIDTNQSLATVGTTITNPIISFPTSTDLHHQNTTLQPENDIINHADMNQPLYIGSTPHPTNQNKSHLKQRRLYRPGRLTEALNYERAHRLNGNDEGVGLNGDTETDVRAVNNNLTILNPDMYPDLNVNTLQITESPDHVLSLDNTQSATKNQCIVPDNIGSDSSNQESEVCSSSSAVRPIQRGLPPLLCHGRKTRRSFNYS